MPAGPRPRGTRSTRQAIVALLEAAPGGLTAAELARSLGLHPNAVRKQLGSLEAGGAIGSEREASGRRGRPAARYRAADPAREAAAVRALATMLAGLVERIGPDPARVEEFGRDQAPRLTAARDGRRALLDLFTAMGFAPREVTGAAAAQAGRLEIELCRCPFRDAVLASGGDLVCVLHRGLSAGLAEMTPGGRLAGFEIRSPETAGCRVAAEGLAPATA